MGWVGSGVRLSVFVTQTGFHGNNKKTGFGCESAWFQFMLNLSSSRKRVVCESDISNKSPGLERLRFGHDVSPAYSSTIAPERAAGGKSLQNRSSVTERAMQTIVELDTATSPDSNVRLRWGLPRTL